MSCIQVKSLPRPDWAHDSSLSVAHVTTKHFLSKHVLLNSNVRERALITRLGNDFFFNGLVGVHEFRQRVACPKPVTDIHRAAKSLGYHTRPSLNMVMLFADGLAVGNVRAIDAAGNLIQWYGIEADSSRLSVFYQEWVVSTNWIFTACTILWCVAGAKIALRTARGIRRYTRGRHGNCSSCGYPPSFATMCPECGESRASATT